MRLRKKPACIYYQPEEIIVPRAGTEVSGSWIRGGWKRDHYRQGTRRFNTRVRRTICRCTIKGSLKKGDLTRFDIYNKPKDSDARKEWEKQFRSLPTCPVLKSKYWNNEHDCEKERSACQGCARRLLYEKQNEENIVLTRLEDKDF